MRSQGSYMCVKVCTQHTYTFKAWQRETPVDETVAARLRMQGTQEKRVLLAWRWVMTGRLVGMTWREGRLRFKHFVWKRCRQSKTSFKEESF